MIKHFSYHRPQTVSDLISILSKKPGCKILAGGTDLIVNMRAGITCPTDIVDIKAIKDLKKTEFGDKQGWFIGAVVTMTQLLKTLAVKKFYPALCEAIELLATCQLRNRATMAGNICNSSPASDTAPPLLIYGAKVVVQSADSRQEIPLEKFFTGVKKNVLKPGEFVSGIIIPPLKDLKAKSGFLKKMRIRGHDLSQVAVALYYSKKDGEIRVAVNSASVTPLLISDFGKLPESRPEIIKTVTAKVLKSIKPISDVRGSAEYKTAMARYFIETLLKKFL